MGRVGPAADAGGPGTSTSFHPPCVHGGPWSLTTLSITLLREVYTSTQERKELNRQIDKEIKSAEPSDPLRLPRAFLSFTH